MKDAKMLAEIMIELHIFFDSDMKKVATWLSTENTGLMRLTPMFLILHKNIEQVHKYVMENMK